MISRVQLPAAWQHQADIGSVMVRAKPLRDDDSVVERCFRCGAHTPLLNTQGDACSSCGAAVQRSFATFDPLPLVEFELAEGISDEEAIDLLASEPPDGFCRCEGDAV